MAEEKTDKSNKKYEKDRDKSNDVKVPPNPERQDLFEWIEKLYAAPDEIPLKLELRQVFGRGCAQMGEGILHLHQQRPDKKLTREDMVVLSNEFSGKAQKDCDGIDKLQRYAIFAYHPQRHDKWYDRFILRLMPREGQTRIGTGLDDEDDEGGGGHNGRAQKLIDAELAHFRFRDTQVGEATANLLEHYAARLEKVEARNESFLDKLGSLMDKFVDQHVKMIKATEEALSQASARKREDAKEDFKIEMLRKGANLVESLAPVALNHAVGQKVLPERSPIAMAVEAFLNGLDEDQRNKAFGLLDDKGMLVKPGIFTLDQVKLFVAIAEGKTDPERIDDFFEGPLTISQEQFAQALGVFRPEQFAGIASIGMQRRAAREAQKIQAQQANQAQAS